MVEAKKKEYELFFPYYINQGRLLDIYAILNDGYSEYAEITTAISDEKAKSGKMESSVNGGFKLFNFGGAISGNIDKKNSQSNESKEKKVQTVTSVLSIVKRALDEKGFLHEIQNAIPGQFVCMPIVLSINSIKAMLIEMSELLKLAENMKKVGAAINGTRKINNDIDGLLKTMQILFDGEEIFYETDNYAVIGTIIDKHLYQAVRSDIIGTELKCLAQVKRVFPTGTELMKNTIFTRIKDTSAKQALVEAISKIDDGNVFDFEAVCVPSIYGKPVYQLEIIALYQ